MKVLYISYRAKKETESTPNLTMEFSQKIHQWPTFSMRTPLETKGDYEVVDFPYLFSLLILFPFFLLRHPLFSLEYIFTRKIDNVGWIKSNIINLVRYAFLKQYIIKHKITHVTIFFGDKAELFAELKRVVPVRIFASFHGHDTAQSYLDGYKIIRKWCDGYIVLCKFLKDDLLSGGFPESKIHLVYTGLNFSSFPYENLPKERKNQILYVGRLTPKKGIFDVLNAYHQIHPNHPATKLIIVGEGDLLKEAQEMVNKYNLESLVEFKGHLRPSEVYALMRESKLFFLPSKIPPNGSREGAPCAIIEAQLMGLPIVSTYHAGIPEVVLENETALLSEEGDVDHLANSLNRLLSDEKLYVQFSTKAHEYVKENFSIEKRIALLTEVYNRYPPFTR